MSNSPAIRQVWVIQCKSTGAFLTSEQGFSSSLRRAGRLTNPEEVTETAVSALDDDYEVFSFYEIVQTLEVFRHYG